MYRWWSALAMLPLGCTALNAAYSDTSASKGSNGSAGTSAGETSGTSDSTGTGSHAEGGAPDSTSSESGHGEANTTDTTGDSGGPSFMDIGIPIVFASVGTDLFGFVALVELDEQPALQGRTVSMLSFRSAEGEPLPYELHAFDADAGSLLAWVELDLPANADTEIVLTVTEANTQPPSPWTGFCARWGFEDEATTESVQGWPSQWYGKADEDAFLDDGVIGNAVVFDGNDELRMNAIECGPEFAAYGWAWVSPDAIPVAPLISRNDGWGAADRVQWGLLVDQPLTYRAIREGGSGPSLSLSDAGEWHHVGLRVSDGQIALFVDGNNEGAMSWEDPGGPEPDMTMGAFSGGSIMEGAGFLDGLLDEVVLIEGDPPDAWFALAHANQADPESTYTVGPAYPL